MARMQGNSVTVGGYGPDYFFIDWQLAGQNEDGNYSTINWQAYMHWQNSDAQLDNGVANLGGAQRWGNGGRVYNYTGNFATRDMGIASGSFNIGHDGNGNCWLDVNGGIDVYQSGRSSGDAGWSLPQLYQAIAFNYVNIVNVTDVGFQVQVGTNRLANLLQYSLDGGAWTTLVNGTYTDTTQQIGSASAPLQSGVNHTLQLRIRRNSNGWVTDSGVYNVALNVQNKFFDIGKI